METPMNSGHSLSESICVMIANVMHIVYYDEIIYLQADDNYTCIHLLNRQSCTICKTLKDFELQLCENHFFRTHKSFMVNLSFIKEIRKKKESEVWLTTGDKIPIARRRLPGLRGRWK